MRPPFVRCLAPLLALSLALGACGKSKSEDRSRRDDDRDDDRSSKKDRDPDRDTKSAPRFRMDVVDATVDETLTAYRRATGNDLGMKDVIRKRVDCVRVTFSVERDSAQDVERALSDKLGEYGLKIEERSGLTGVVRDYAKPTSPCAVAGREDEPDPLDPGSRPRLPPTSTDPPPDGIEKLSEDHYRIERTTLEGLKADSKAARTMPHTSGTKGISLYGIRHNGVLYALGFRNGDIIERVNGFDVSDATKALEVYAKLRDATTFVVELERRRGATTKVTIDVVPDGTVGKAITKSPTALPP